MTNLVKSASLAICNCWYLCSVFLFLDFTFKSSSHDVAPVITSLNVNQMRVKIHVKMSQRVRISISADRSVWVGVCIQTSDHFLIDVPQLLISTGVTYVSSAPTHRLHWPWMCVWFGSALVSAVHAHSPWPVQDRKIAY